MRRVAKYLGILGILVLVAGACDPGFSINVAGNGSYGQPTTGPAVEASFSGPASVVATPDGGFDFVDVGTCRVFHVGEDKMLSVLAGNGICGFSGDDGPASEASLNISSLFGAAWLGRLAVDGLGNTYVFDTGNGRIRKIDSAGTISTFAGDGTATSGCFRTPPVQAQIVATSDGMVYVTCVNTLMSVAPDGTVTTVPVTVSGSNFGGSYFGVTIDSAGNLYASLQFIGTSSGFHRIDTTTGIATLETPYVSNTITDIQRDTSGNFYAIAGGRYRQIVRISPDGTTTTIAGNGSDDPNNTALVGAATELPYNARGISITPNNGLLFTSGRTVYRLWSPATAPSAPAA